MDFTDPPQGAHTSHLRTLSKIKGLRDFLLPAPEDISSEGAAYYTTNSETVNTFSKTFSSCWGGTTTESAFFIAGRFGLHVEGARILTIENGIGKGFGEEFFVFSRRRFVAPFR